jgi:uncharacterized membrane protein
MAMSDSTKAPRGLGNRVAPPRFLIFMILGVVGVSAGISFLGWRVGSMIGFDVAALVFLLSCVPLLDNPTESMRLAARRNDANRAVLLAISVTVSLAVLVAVAAELSQQAAADAWSIALVLVTLALAWLFSNTIYALHYTHMFYVDHGGKDCGGLVFPGTEEPDYWDFIYYAFCLGMTFQTSDVSVTDGRFRRATTGHCLAAFVFNLGVIAFTINVLGGR